MNKLVASLFAGLFLVPVVLAACGDSSADSPGRFEAACEKACEKLASLGCENFPTKPGQCAAGCPYLEEQLDGLCVAEYADLYECSADLEYTCVDGNPNPTDLNAAAKCNDPSMALATCMQGMDCKKYCRAATKAGCGGSSEDACVADCEAARPADAFCSSDYDRLRECQTENMTCQSGKPSSADCQFERSELGQCFGDFGSGDPCAGYCFFAIDEGCETGGAETCKTSCGAGLMQAPSCAQALQTWNQCRIDNDTVCSPDSTACQSSQDAYQSCLANGGA